MTKIVPLTEQYYTKWDEYIKKCPEGVFHQSIGWKNVIEKNLNLRPFYSAALTESDEISGVLPLILMRDVVGRKYLVSLPYSTYAGVCAEDNIIKTDLLRRAKEIAVENGVQYLELRQLAGHGFDLPTREDFVVMVSKLSGDEEIEWENLHKRRRNDIRKAYNEGLTVDFDKSYLDEFYTVLSIKQRDLGTPNYPKQFLRTALDEFGSAANVIVVKYRGRVIGGSLFIGFGNSLSPCWFASLSKYNNLCPNDILIWEIIKYACRNGIAYLDHGRSTVNSGTHMFKKKWGAETVQLHYQYIFNKGKKIPIVSANEDNKYQAAINIWKKLPLAVAERLGSKLIRYLPEL